MKRALRQAGVTFSNEDPTRFLEELVVLAYKPSMEQFNGVVARAKEAIE